VTQLRGTTVAQRRQVFTQKVQKATDLKYSETKKLDASSRFSETGLHNFVSF
jgi:hypothetical protein